MGQIQAIQTLLAHADFHEGEMWQRVRYPANHTIICEGDETRDIYLIMEGSLRVIGSVPLEMERKVRPGVCELSKGDVFGELALFDQQPRSASVVTLTECELAVIDGQRLMTFLDDHPDIGYLVIKALMQEGVTRLRETNRKLFSLFAWGLKAHQIDKHL